MGIAGLWLSDLTTSSRSREPARSWAGITKKETNYTKEYSNKVIRE